MLDRWLKRGFFATATVYLGLLILEAFWPDEDGDE